MLSSCAGLLRSAVSPRGSVAIGSRESSGYSSVSQTPGGGIAALSSRLSPRGSLASVAPGAMYPHRLSLLGNIPSVFELQQAQRKARLVEAETMRVFDMADDDGDDAGDYARRHHCPRSCPRHLIPRTPDSRSRDC